MTEQTTAAPQQATQTPQVNLPAKVTPYYCGEEILATGVSYPDYLKRFDSVRAEWLMGVVIKHMSNNKTHQMSLIFLIALVRAYLQYRQIGQVFPAGYSMYIKEDQPAREPDLLVVLNKNRERAQYSNLRGAADVAVEIVSPESGRRDRGTKVEEYEAAGVAEYWLIDPLHKGLMLYRLNAEGRHEQQNPNAQGRIHSHVLPGFYLSAASLWRDDLDQVDFIALAQEMADTDN